MRKKLMNIEITYNRSASNVKLFGKDVKPHDTVMAHCQSPERAIDKEEFASEIYYESEVVFDRCYSSRSLHAQVSYISKDLCK
jgi:hypothetical protein